MKLQYVKYFLHCFCFCFIFVLWIMWSRAEHQKQYQHCADFGTDLKPLKWIKGNPKHSNIWTEQLRTQVFFQFVQVFFLLDICTEEINWIWSDSSWKSKWLVQRKANGCIMLHNEKSHYITQLDRYFWKYRLDYTVYCCDH